MRKSFDLNQNWFFVKHAENAAAAACAAGEAVTLPHTWNAADGMDGGNDYYRGTCWYVRQLERPVLQAGERVFLELPAAAVTADVYLNGKKLAHHEGGYALFRVDLTDGLQESNVLAIACDNSDNDHVYPQKADFTFYGGLPRGANLLVVPAVHFALTDSGSTGVFATPEVHLSAAGASADVLLEARVEGAASGCRVSFRLDGVTQTAEVRDGRAETVFHLAPVHLWDGRQDPWLYIAAAKLSGAETGGEDEVRVRFGCRSFRIDPQEGFLLNGRSCPLRGVSRHQDRAGYGNALTDAMQKEDMELIQEIGANTIRLAHYQHSQEFYDLCDEAGMIIWTEIPYISVHMPAGRENTLSQMRELILQNRNHPSVVCWGLSNEITAGSAVSEDLMENHRELNDLCHKLDPTRPTTMADVFMLETDSPLLAIPDVNSYNLYFGWYLGTLEQNEQFFDAYHAQYPDRAIGFSEYGAECNVRFQTSRPECGDYTEQYQCLYHEHMLQMFESRPYIWATHVWNMFDFGSDGKDEGGSHGFNQKGLVTGDRKLRKDAFYLYKAYWSSEAFVHLCGSRYVDRAEEVTEIKVYSNQPSVTLFVDGVEFEKQDGSRIFRFRVPISGEHRIEARAGALTDSILIRKAEAPNPAYVFSGSTVTNWLSGLSMDDSCYSIKDTLGTLTENPQTAVIVGRLMQQASKSRGEVAEATKDNAALQRMMARMPLAELLKRAGSAVTKEQTKQLNDALQKIRKG